MKHISSLMLSLCSVLGFSQTILYQAETASRTVQDPQTVVMAQGFRAAGNVSNPFVAKIGPTTENPGGGPTNSNAGAGNPNGTSAPAGKSFHDTKGDIEITGAGQLQFTLPIALPPGVKSVAPQVNLVYTSGSGNGIAGYGWNISGITAISRISKNIERDGATKGIQLDYSDSYSFNGQKLILKSGEYGKDGAEYYTEKYSNTKIRSVGNAMGISGPDYWEVTFEDGSQAIYEKPFTNNGNGSGIPTLEYNITKWKDIQGNYISYTYEYTMPSGFRGVDGGVSRISSIYWGGNETLNKPHYNGIQFNYSDRGFNEVNYLKGYKFTQDKILKEIIVTSNGNPFKKYGVEYGDNGTSYQFVNKITEYNAANEAANPVEIVYETASPGSEENSRESDVATTNTKKYGDFNMDGITDYLEFLPNPGSTPSGPVGSLIFRSSVYKSVPPVPLQYPLGSFTEAEFAKGAPIVFKKSNMVKNTVGIVIPHKLNTPSAAKPDYEFQVYSVDLQNYKFNLEYTKILSYDQYTMSDGDEDDLSPWCDYSGIMMPEFTSYDYNGDGISELLISFSRSKTCTDPDILNPVDPGISVKTGNVLTEELAPHVLEPSIDSTNTEFAGNNQPDSTENVKIINPGGITRTQYSSSMLFDLDENLNSDQSIYVFENRRDAVNRKVQFADLNGDGIQDIIWLNLSNGALTKVFNIQKTASGNFQTADVGNFTGQILGGFFHGALYGDFNGDSKVDILVPQANKSYNWNLFVSDGNQLKQSYINNFIFYFSGTETISKDTHNTWFEKSCTSGVNRYFQYNTADLDGDGKSEILVSNVLINDHQWNAHHDKEWTNTHVTVYSVNKLPGASNKGIVYNPPMGPNWPLNLLPSNDNVENTAAIETNSGINFYRTRDWKKNFNEKVIPFSNLSLNRDNQQIILMGRPDDCAGVVGCPYNHVIQYNYPYVPALARVKNIKQGGITTEFVYQELNSKTDANFYKPIKKELYPYYELEQMPLSLAVSQLKQYTPAGTLIQDFRYRGFLTHFTGKGIIGFRQAARSSLYVIGKENTKIWTGEEIDPLNDGVPVKEWSIRTNDDSKVFPDDLSENNSQLLSFKSTIYKTDKLINNQVVAAVPSVDKSKVVTATVPIATKVKDFLTNVLTTNTISYGDYYLASQTVSNINNGFSTKTTQLEYSHNPGGVGKDYYIGRLFKKTEENTAYSSTAKNIEQYTYEDNKLKTIKTTVGNDSNNYILDDYAYDGFGNMVEKKSTSNDAQIQTVKTQYDTLGRFVIKKTDNLGLETNITYNDWGQILTQTDPLGNVSENTYDKWGKILTAKTSLNGITNYQYTKDEYDSTTITQYDPNGNVSKKTTNKLGQDYRIVTKAFGQGQYVAKDIQYDVLGRKVVETEPYFEDQSPTQWNTIEYDDSVFPAKTTVTSFTGKKVISTVVGLTTTVKEDNGYLRTTTKTLDALGNVASTSDKGGTINFSYNATGKQVKAQYAENIVTTKYDDWGRKIEFNDPSNGVYKYEYNGFGQTKKIISPKGTKEYTYNNLGQLISQNEISTVDGGQSTNKVISFIYDEKGRLTSKTGTSKGKAYSSNIAYDPQGRVLSSSESNNGKYFIQKGMTYDDKGRVVSYEKQLYSSGVLTKVILENVYSAWSGDLYQVKDKKSGKILWELKGTNAKGQVLQSKLGAAEVTNMYDNNSFLTSTNHSSQIKQNILQLTYSFDAIKNELRSRVTGGDFNITESFDYDDNNRLVNWTNPVTGIKTQNATLNVYDAKGRILENNQVGKIKFENSSKIYQPTGMTLNAAGTQNYTNDLIQSIVYNENNDPVFIDGEKGDVAFQYGLTAMRQRVTYGGNFNPDADGKFTKFYNEDGSFEVVLDNTTGKEKHVLYIGGTPYESNILFVKNYTESNGSYKFLHKDYLGSILAITDEAGNKLEQRHFDAWGNFTHLQIGNGPIETDVNKIKEIVNTGGLLLERGYTSHEHFMEVGIIHMNGRLYDPLLRRFLNADENIQDPYNTQNYNKYGYVMNNPLMFNDPSGEIFGLVPLLSAVIIGAFIGTVAYIVSSLITGQSITLLGIFKSTIFGAISGAVTFGIGSIFSVVKEGVQVATALADSLGKVGTVFVQAAAHGIAQGTLSLMQGGSFHQALISGALGSLGASAFGAVAKSAANSLVGKIAFGAMAGGIGSELAGGNFWQGAVIGGIVAGLNHGLHEMDGPGDDKPKKSSNYKIPRTTVSFKVEQGAALFIQKDSRSVLDMDVYTIKGTMTLFGNELTVTAIGATTNMQISPYFFGEINITGSSPYGLSTFNVTIPLARGYGYSAIESGYREVGTAKYTLPKGTSNVDVRVKAGYTFNLPGIGVGAPFPRTTDYNYHFGNGVGINQYPIFK
ncbi:RHS repeat-associated core domain-containing protein [Chryseobacterium indologenes]|uniref:RHS repeat-associated core domain-containing protein n=1 Tax=Chryseobacterium indologenes TaxID=253 RepID=UPI000B51972F|nr:RHS repeat-associated core domain-containing protein [Chryseobacterium indologenes]ASE62716.1 hypothetical protein CEQ15_15010 [Chryseobacterium indologenes]VFA42222.1 Cell wall-associated polypeptide CWBP200 [Chryseobacterium indologenes]